MFSKILLMLTQMLLHSDVCPVATPDSTAVELNMTLNCAADRGPHFVSFSGFLGCDNLLSFLAIIQVFILMLVA
jgi:hypothetical protein